jgi:hypothetical protein
MGGMMTYIMVDVEAGALVPLNEDEQKIIEEIAQKCSPIFPWPIGRNG